MQGLLPKVVPLHADLRQQLLAAHSNEQLLERQIALILDVQEAWRLADLRASSANGGN